MGRNLLQFLRRWWLDSALVVSVANLGWLVYASATALGLGEVPSLRNADFPNTYIERIHLDLTPPNQYVTLTWDGPNAASQEAGPFHSSPGRVGARTIAMMRWKAIARIRGVRQRGNARWKVSPIGSAGPDFAMLLGSTSSERSVFTRIHRFLTILHRKAVCGWSHTRRA